MNQSEMLARFASETDVDVLLVANRRDAARPGRAGGAVRVVSSGGIAVQVAGVRNSGLMVDLTSQGRATFDYGPAPDRVVERARRISAVRGRHGIAVRAAAIQFLPSPIPPWSG